MTVAFVKLLTGLKALLLFQVCWNTTVLEAYGGEKGTLAGVKVKNVQTGEVSDIKVLILC